MSRHHDSAKWAATSAKLRARYKPQVDSGNAVCGRCRRPIHPGEPWDVGHVVDLSSGQPSQGYRTEHRRCNRSAGGKLGAAKTNHTKTTERREDKRLGEW